MNGEGHVFTGILTVDFLYLISLINSYPFFTFRTKKRFQSILNAYLLLELELLDSNALTLGYRQSLLENYLQNSSPMFRCVVENNSSRFQLTCNEIFSYMLNPIKVSADIEASMIIWEVSCQQIKKVFAEIENYLYSIGD